MEPMSKPTLDAVSREYVNHVLEQMRLAYLASKQKTRSQFAQVRK